MKLFLLTINIFIFTINILLGQNRIYTPIAVFNNSHIDHELFTKLRAQDSSAEARLMADEKPPYKFVETSDIVNAFMSNKPSLNKVYVMASTEKIVENKSPYIGSFLHVILCIEVDRENKFVSGYSFPLEYSMHFLSSEIKKITILDGKFESMAKVDFLKAEKAKNNYSLVGILDISLLNILVRHRP